MQSKTKSDGVFALFRLYDVRLAILEVHGDGVYRHQTADFDVQADLLEIFRRPVCPLIDETGSNRDFAPSLLRDVWCELTELRKGVFRIIRIAPKQHAGEFSDHASAGVRRIELDLL